MDYKIIAVNAAIGQLTIMFVDSAGAEVATFAVDVSIEDGAFITGDRLEAEIQQRAPTWLLDRTTAVSTVSNFAHLESLVDPDYVVSVAAVPQVWEEVVVTTDTVTTAGTETNNVNVL